MRLICDFDLELCELNYGPPEYPNPNYPKGGDCKKCWRNPKNDNKIKMER